MPDRMIFEERWEEICTDRLGVAQLTTMAFGGQDLRPLQDRLIAEMTDDRAGAGRGMDLSIIAQLLGDRKTGLAIQDEILPHQKLFRSPQEGHGDAARPRLRLLALAAVTDIGGNTPLEFLLEGSGIELATCYITPGMPLPSPMPEHDLAIVVAQGGDAGADTLAAIQTLLADWPRPVLNPPERIRLLDRDRLFQLLSGIPGLQIPQTRRIDRAELAALGSGARTLTEMLEDGAFPLIIRPLCSHAGFGLAKIDDARALLGYAAERSEEAFFISRFVDYAGPDEMFRKYRVAIVDGKAYACHMAICDEWKVWYLNADMAVSVPYRLEEAAFMHNFDTDFAARHQGAFAELIGRIGLDYFVIDCAETVSGELLIFEADNTAIVHDMDPPSVYPYKSVPMRKIFGAFQQMLAGRLRRESLAA